MEQQTTIRQVITKFAIIYALAMIGFALVSYILEQPNNWILNTLSIAANIAILFFGLKTRKNEIESGNLTYGQGVGTGIGIVAIGAFILTVYTLIFNNFIDPEYMNAIMQKTKIDMMEKGMSDEQIEGAMKMTEKFKNPIFSSFMTYFGSLFFGTILTLIVAIFTKNNKSNSEVHA